MKKPKSEKKYECSFCEVTSSRKYNLEVHIKRKHPGQQQQQPTIKPYWATPSTNSSSYYNEYLNEETFTKSDSNNFVYEPTLMQYFPSTFMNNKYFEYFEYLENQKKQEKRTNERRFYQMINMVRYYFTIFNNNINTINMPIWYYQFPSYSKGNQIPPYSYNNIKNHSDPKLFTDLSTKMPKAHKIYKCKSCLIETLLPIFDFNEIPSIFEHECLNNSSTDHFAIKNYNDYYSDKIQDLLLSIIDSRNNSDKLVLETFLLPDILIQNPICFFILEIIETVFDVNLIPKWIFKLLKAEKFTNLGEIDSEHWAFRAYVSQNEIFLEKKELQSIVRTLHSTFGLVTFKINNKRKCMFCYIPLINKFN
jgi:hypothetical protein